MKINYPTYTERMEKFKAVRMKSEAEFDLFYANIGDEVFYQSYNKLGVLMHSGQGVVVDMTMYCYNRLSVQYKVRDNSTGKTYEIMHNVPHYAQDLVQLIYRREKPMFYCGYDTLTKQIIPNTMGKFKSDVKEELTKKFGTSWETENQFIEIRSIEISVLDV